jgi:hypothetical protein
VLLFLGTEMRLPWSSSSSQLGLLLLLLLLLRLLRLLPTKLFYLLLPLK